MKTSVSLDKAIAVSPIETQEVGYAKNAACGLFGPMHEL